MMTMMEALRSKDSAKWSVVAGGFLLMTVIGSGTFSYGLWIAIKPPTPTQSIILVVC